MKTIKWDEEKNKKLKNSPDRGISFDDVISALNDGNFYTIEDHPNQEKLWRQQKKYQ